jgi:hypothetical protein
LIVRRFQSQGIRIINRIIIIVLLLLPVFNQYDFNGIEVRLSSFLLILSVIIIFMLRLLSKRRFKIYRNDILYPIVILVFWQIVITTLYLMMDTYRITIGYAIFIPIILVATLYLVRDLDLGPYIIQAYINISNIIIIFLVLQILSYYSLGLFLPGRIPILSLANEFRNIPIFGVDLIGNISFSSVFSEKAKFAQYIMPYLCLCIFGYRDIVKKNMLKAVIITIMMCLTLSGNAVVVCAIIWFMYFYLSSDKGIMHKFFYIIGGVVAIYLAFMILDNIPVFNDLFSRLFSDQSGSTYYYSKADYRIYRGLDYYINLPFCRQIFGIGFGALTSYANKFGIISQYDVVGVYAEYLSAIWQVMIYTGIVGLALYVKYFIGLHNKSQESFKVCTIAFFALSISSSIYFEYMWLVYSLLIVCNISVNDVRNF